MSSVPPAEETVDDIQVRLKPIFGIAPKYYLAGIYVLVILAALFGLLVYPGLSSPGTRVTFTSVPAGASVTFAGKHWGSTPLTAYLPEKTAALVVGKPGFVADERQYSSGNNVFFSLFFPKTDTIAVTLKPESETSVADRFRQEAGRWSLAVPFTSLYKFPPLFTRFAEDARAAGWDAARIKDFLLGFRAAVADPQMYADYGRALGLWTEAPADLEQQFKLWEPLVGSGSGRLALWLLPNQSKPVRDRELTEPSDWFKARTTEFAAGLALPAVNGAAPPPVRSALGSFRGVAPAAFLWGADAKFSPPTEPPFALPVPARTAAFWIAEAEVTRGQFAAFQAAVPQWAAAARDNLIQSGLADADYLAGWKDGDSPSAPVRSVSWYAAQAYVDWVNATKQAPAGKKAVLPSDFQWEAAARGSGVKMLNQGVWEWTASAWYPGQSLVWTGETGTDAAAYARSLKGGAEDSRGNVKVTDRAGWPAAGATIGLGFRLALVDAP